MYNPIGIYAHPNKRYHDALLKKVCTFYDEVINILSYMGHEQVDRECAWIRKALFTANPVCLTDRSDWRLKHIKQLNAVMQCKPGWNCRHLIYCPDCLANWRYTHAATIREMKKQSSDLRLILRRDSFLVPRGVYVSYDGYKKGLLINTSINPVYELPRNENWRTGTRARVYESERLKEFWSDIDSTSDAYSDLLPRTWKLIGGFNTVENPLQLDYFNSLSPEAGIGIHQQFFNQNALIQSNIQKGVSDMANNPLIAELLARATMITKKFRNNSKGYIHRVIVVPSNVNSSVIMVRLDSLFLAPRRIYDRLKKEDSMWKTDKHYRKIPFWEKAKSVWSVCNKITTNCRVIPDDIHEILGILENRFPYTGNWFTNFLPQEFPFYMNCFSQYHYHRTAGVFARRS